MPDSRQISKDFRDRLRIADPELSTAMGTPVRKILDAVAESLSELSFDNYFDHYRFDLDAYSDSDLDEFVGLFGFQRQRARSAVGTVTIERENADTSISIPPNTQFFRPTTAASSAVYFATTGYSYMGVGITSVSVPVRAAIAGSDGNVAARAITGFSLGSGIMRIYNSLPTTGGADDESDDQLRARFRATVFRNVAGTKDQYMGLALAHALVSRATLVGQTSIWSEIVTMVDIGDGYPEATSTNNEVLSLLSPTYGVWLYDIEGVDHGGTAGYYTTNVDYDVIFDNDEVNFKGLTDPAVSITSGTICRMEYEYISTVNRNISGEVNTRAVELIVDGEDSVSVVAEMVLNKNLTFSNNGDEMDSGNWIRLDDTTKPTQHNVFIALPFQPVLGLPDSIEFGSGVSLQQGVGFHFVRDNTAWRGAVRSKDGIEFVGSAISGIADYAIFNVTYNYNRVPQAVQDLVEQHRQVTADVLVHAAKKRYFKPRLEVMYSTFPRASVDSRIEDALNEFFDNVPMGAWIQLPDIEKVVHDVSGVDSVRLVAGDCLVEYASDGVTTMGSSPHTQDVKLRSDEIPVLFGVDTINRTQELWT